MPSTAQGNVSLLVGDILKGRAAATGTSDNPDQLHLLDLAGDAVEGITLTQKQAKLVETLCSMFGGAQSDHEAKLVVIELVTMICGLHTANCAGPSESPLRKGLRALADRHIGETF
jgi:hypothetical protein